MRSFAKIFDTPSPVALVTGSGAARVGNVIARDLSSAGCAVVLHARTSIEKAEATAAELRVQGGKTLVVTGDVGVEDDVRLMFAAIENEFGRLDVMVNSAAIYQRKRLEEVTAADVIGHFNANALGTYLCSQLAGLKMCQQPSGGVIVNLGDWSTVRPYRDFSAYFPSKGAVEAITFSLAVELSARNPRVRVNAILPGPVLFPPDMSNADREAQIASTLVKRPGTPEHVAHAVRFLIQNEFVTGVCLPVDGGRSIYAGPDTDQQYVE